jgi:hypothetical protein
MKFFKVSILAFFILIYSVASTGLLVKVHYCCGDLKSISLITPKSCCGKSEKSKGCCHNETKYFKVKDKQVQSDESGEMQPLVAIVESIDFQIIYIDIKPEVRISNPLIYDPPPLHVKTPLFIKNRVLII